MKSQILVINNFFEDVNNIRNTALSSKYKQPRKNLILYDKKEISPYIDGWRGFRCKLDKDSNIEYQKILETVKHFYSLDGKQIMQTCFHYSLEETKKTCYPSFDEYKYHRDESLYAGVVYLHPNPPKDSGTTIILNNEKKYVENIFNRLVCYPSNLLHGPTDLFGHDKYTSRMTLTFFIYNNYV